MRQTLLYALGLLSLTASAAPAPASSKSYHAERELLLSGTLDFVSDTVNGIADIVDGSSPPPSTSASLPPSPPPKIPLGLGALNLDVLSKVDLIKGVVHIGDSASSGHASLVSIDLTKLKDTLSKLHDGLLGGVIHGGQSLIGATVSTILGGVLGGAFGDTLDGILCIGNSANGDNAGDCLIFIDLNLLDVELLKGDVEALLDGIVRVGNSADGDAPKGALICIDLNMLSSGLPPGGLVDGVVGIGNTRDGYQPGESLIFIDLSLLSGDLLSAMVHVGDSADNGLALVQLDSSLLRRELLTDTLLSSLLQIGDASDGASPLVQVQNSVLSDALIELTNVITLGSVVPDKLSLVKVDSVLPGATSLLAGAFNEVDSLVQIGDMAAGKHALLHVTAAMARSLVDRISKTVIKINNLVTVGDVVEVTTSLVHLDSGLLAKTLLAAEILDKVGCIVHVGTLGGKVHAVVNIASDLVHTAKHLLGGVSDLVHLGAVDDSVTSLIQVDGDLLGLDGVVSGVLDKVESLVQIGDLMVGAHALIQISGVVAADLIGTVDVKVDGLVDGVVRGAPGAVNNLVHIGGVVSQLKSLVHLDSSLLGATGKLVAGVLDKVGCIVHVGTLGGKVHAIVNIASDLVRTAKHLLGGLNDLVHLGAVVGGVTSLIQVDGDLLGLDGVVSGVLGKIESLVQIGDQMMGALALIQISGVVAADLIGTVNVNVDGLVDGVVRGAPGAVNNLVHIGGVVSQLKSLVHLDSSLLGATGKLVAGVLDKVKCIVHVGTLGGKVHAIVNIASDLVRTAKHLLGGLNDLVHLGAVVGGVTSLIQVDGDLLGLDGVASGVLDKVESLVQIGDLMVGAHALIQISGAVAADLVGTVNVNGDGLVDGVVGGAPGAVNNLVHIGGGVSHLKSLVHLDSSLLGATGMLVAGVLDQVGCIVHVGTLGGNLHAVVNIASDLVYTAKHLIGGMNDLVHLGAVVGGVTSLIQVDGDLLGLSGVVSGVLDKVEREVKIGDLMVGAHALIQISGVVAADLVGTVHVNLDGLVDGVVGFYCQW